MSVVVRDLALKVGESIACILLFVIKEIIYFLIL